MDAIVSSVQMGNIEHTVKDILKSYYKVARKRFVDVVCMQAADHFLVTVSESPLRLFTPSFVHRLSLDSLNLIAEEDVVSKRTRNVLIHEIKCLKGEKKLLKGRMATPVGGQLMIANNESRTSGHGSLKF